MQIHELQLAADLPAELVSFYRDTLSLTVQQELPTSVLLCVGASRLRFTKAEQSISGVYHFAFNVPENQFAAAKSWLSQRVSLLGDATGVDDFYSELWNAHMVYFADPVGNILELVARHTHGSASAAAFSSASLLNISEIGIAAADVAAQVAAMQARAAIPHYRDRGSSSFSAIGDDDGLFIVVAQGRIWFPNTGKPAMQLPLRVLTGDPAQPTIWEFGS